MIKYKIGRSYFMSLLNSPDSLKKIQVVMIAVLAFGAIAYVGYGAYHYGFDSTEGKSLFNDMKLIVIAGVLAAFALLGLGRRTSTDKPT